MPEASPPAVRAPQTLNLTLVLEAPAPAVRPSPNVKPDTSARDPAACHAGAPKRQT